LRKTISRKRIVELVHESTEEPYKFDDGWIARFMLRLNKESPELAEEIVKQSTQRLKEINDKTI
jgi:hypothetical protein